MPWNTGLAGTHLNIAAYGGSPLRVVAGPSSRVCAGDPRSKYLVTVEFVVIGDQ